MNRNQCRARRCRFPISRSAFCAVPGLALLLLLSCQTATNVTVMSAQVSRRMDYYLQTATVVLGNVELQAPDFAATPDPDDTVFGADDFPVGLTPVKVATVELNNERLNERIDGIYFRFYNDIEYLEACNLTIDLPTIEASPPVTGHTVLPDSFTVTQPGWGASLGPDTLRVAWSVSDSARVYYVRVMPVDTTSDARGYLASTSTDTTLLVPAEAFHDSAGNYQPGAYAVHVWAVNGGWKQSGFSLRTGGSVKNAVGLFGAATYAIPVPVTLR